MGKDLIIVESPAKVRTIGKFLGKGYQVEASVGHVRDLPTKTLGVDEAHGFAPQYEIIRGKEDVVKRLKQAAAKAERVYLAPDPDREGEAIAWHVAELIRDKNANVSRILFNEITARAVKEALAKPRPLDQNLFESQQARRILDRLVGYKISPILWKHVKRGISAGRVQSVALKILVEREKERRAFTPVEYWPFKARLAASTPPEFTAELFKIGGKPVKPGSGLPKTEAEALALAEELAGAPFTVESVEEKERRRAPAPPFITSTLQQEANRRLGFPGKKTMRLAQDLYEGVELGERGTTALITYMRTDSVRVADEARNAAREFIQARFGPEFVPAKLRSYKSKGSAQDAHEACRPVDVTLAPEDVKPYLSADQFRLYQLIWQRFVASQMSDARFWDTLALIAAGRTLWRAKGERLLFPGFLAALSKVVEPVPEQAQDEDAEDRPQASELPKLSKGERLAVREVKREQKFTQPPPRFTEAMLVKTLEELGIGRPSTYAAIVSTLVDRDYARIEDKHFSPTELGFTVSDQLSLHFPALMDEHFTANMEAKLDLVAEGREDWSELVRKFAADFYPLLETAGRAMARAALETGIACPECGKPMVVKFGKTGEFLGCSGYPECKCIRNFTRDEGGSLKIRERELGQAAGISCELCGKPMLVKASRRGEFLGCSGYPECRNIKNFVRDAGGKITLREAEAVKPVGTCPDCGGDLVLKRARTGNRFKACVNYPKCKHAEAFSTGVKCPRENCGGELVEKGSRTGKVFYSCSRYPACDCAFWDWPVPGPCPECGSLILVRKSTRARGPHLSCPKRGCGYTAEITDPAVAGQTPGDAPDRLPRP